jgi:hypothetical protein
MDTHKALAELARFAGAAAQGNSSDAGQHVRQFYHLGSSLVASKEFQSRWQAKHRGRLEPQLLDDACRLLLAIAEAEAAQIAMNGGIAA